MKLISTFLFNCPKLVKFIKLVLINCNRRNFRVTRKLPQNLPMDISSHDKRFPKFHLAIPLTEFGIFKYQKFISQDFLP